MRGLLAGGAPVTRIRMTAAQFAGMGKPAKLNARLGARGRRVPGEMNGTETRYSVELEGRKRLGEIEWYAFEAITFKLGKDCRYTPDFIVMLPDGLLEAHEVKGRWEDDALVKVRVAAAMFPFRFVALEAQPKKLGGGFKTREF